MMVDYKQYKSTRYQWIGVIPVHWDCNRVGRTTYVKGRIGWKGLRTEDFLEEGPYLITGTDFINGSINWSTCYRVDKERYEEDPFIILQNDDVLITKDGTIGKIAHIKEINGPSTLNSGVFVTRPYDDEYLQRYFYWVLSSSLFSKFIEYNSSGSTVLHLYQNVFERFFFPLPTLPEQKLISQYLDKKIDKVDNLIKKIKDKIELLKEQKTALVNQYVTKGVNPNAEMRESSTDWIGDIPKNWEMTKLKYLSQTNVQYGLNLESDLYRKNGIRFLRITDINKDGSLKNKGRVFLDKSNVPDEYILKKGDILFSRSGATVGKSTLIKSNSEMTSFAGYLVRFSFRNYHLSSFISFFAQSSSFWSWIKLQTIQSTIQNVNGEKYANLTIPLPPEDEMIKINDLLRVKINIINTLLEKEESRKTYLNEYRESLIYSVVTGKILITEDMI